MENSKQLEETIRIMRVIWSSRTAEQLEGCENMLEAFNKRYPSNLGTTFIRIEMCRQQRLNGLFAKMGKVQDALQTQNAENKKKAERDNLSLN